MIKKNCITFSYVHNLPNKLFLSDNSNLLSVKILVYIALFFFFFNAEHVKYSLKKKKIMMTNIIRAPYRYKLSRHQLGLKRFFFSITVVFKNKLVVNLFIASTLTKLFSSFSSSFVYLTKFNFFFFFECARCISI